MMRNVQCVFFRVKSALIAGQQINKVGYFPHSRVAQNLPKSEFYVLHFYSIF